MKRDRDNLRALIREMGFHEIETELLQAARPSIRVETTPIEDENNLPIGASKIGGRPDLPIEMNWITVPNGDKRVSLPFLAQFDLKDIKPYDEEGFLPDQGWLYFFGDPWSVPKYADQGRVIYFEGDISLLERKEFPDDIPDVELHTLGERYNACKLTFIAEVNLPFWDANWIEPEYPEGKTLTDFSRLVAVASYPQPAPPIHQTVNRLLGYNYDVPEDFQTECQLIADTGTPHNASPQARNRARQNAGEWQLLFQLASDGNAGMMWSDMGIVCFYMRREDLRERHFENSCMVFFSS